MSDITLKCFYNNEEIFSSKSNWLHPIFELEDFLKGKNYNNEDLYVEDKIIGLAAANLFIYLGIGKVYTETISKPAFFFFGKTDITYSYSNVIEKVNCETEELLSNVKNVNKAYSILKERANR